MQLCTATNCQRGNIIPVGEKLAVMAGALDDQVIYILSDESLNRLMHDEALIQSIKLTDNIEDKRGLAGLGTTSSYC